MDQVTRGPDAWHATLAWAFGCAVLALVLGSLYVYPRQWTRGFLINDEAWYAEPARNMADGRGFVTETLYPMFARRVESLPMNEPFKQIGYPWVVAVASRVTGVMSDQLFIAVAIVGLGLTGMTTWLVTASLVKSRVAAGAITLAAIGNPVSLSCLTAALPESLFAALFLGGLWLLLQPSTPAKFASGALLAASAYFKGFAILYLPIVLAYLVLERRTGRVGQVVSFSTGVVLSVVLAEALLPFGARQLAAAGGNYAGSMLLYETRGASPAPEGILYDTSPPNPVTYILAHPLDYGEKVARMVSRTKAVVEELGGPAFGGVLLPILLFVALSVGCGWIPRLRRAASGSGPGLGDVGPAPAVLLVAGLIAANFAFFWAGNFKARYFVHLFPLMLAAAVVELERLAPAAREWWRRAPTPLVAALAAYFLVLPPMAGLWNVYRDPYAYLTRMLVVRWADYGQVASNVRAHVPEEAMVMSDMAHEISWYTGRPTVFFPGTEQQVEFLVEKFDVQALYEHPKVTRDWPTLRKWFELADDRNGRFWIRRH